MRLQYVAAVENAHFPYRSDRNCGVLVLLPTKSGRNHRFRLLAARLLKACFVREYSQGVLEMGFDFEVVRNNVSAGKEV